MIMLEDHEVGWTRGADLMLPSGYCCNCCRSDVRVWLQWWRLSNSPQEKEDGISYSFGISILVRRAIAVARVLGSREGFECFSYCRNI